MSNLTMAARLTCKKAVASHARITAVALTYAGGTGLAKCVTRCLPMHRKFPKHGVVSPSLCSCKSMGQRLSAAAKPRLNHIPFYPKPLLTWSPQTHARMDITCRLSFWRSRRRWRPTASYQKLSRCAEP